jgi:hypothetical protein
VALIKPPHVVYQTSTVGGKCQLKGGSREKGTDLGYMPTATWSTSLTQCPGLKGGGRAVLGGVIRA